MKVYVNDGEGIMNQVRSVREEANTERNKQRLYYHYDSLGSVSLITSEIGKPLQVYCYTPYGEAYNVAEDSVNGLRFIGRYGGYTDDDTGLTYFWHRWYDSDDGRWISRDPLAQLIKVCSARQLKNGLIFNEYNYTFNNAIHFIDADGKRPARGFNYCGPGNNPNTKPTNELDEACKAHDECYKELGLSGLLGVVGPFLDKCTKLKKDQCDDKLCDKAGDYYYG